MEMAKFRGGSGAVAAGASARAAAAFDLLVAPEEPEMEDDELIAVGGFMGLEVDEHDENGDASAAQSRGQSKCLQSTPVEGDSSQLFSWGTARNYTLGHRDGDNKSRPTKLNISSNSVSLKICDVSTSSYHTLFLSEAGEVLSCGFGRGHRLGTGTVATRLEPLPIEHLKHVRCKHIAAGRNHSAVVSNDGHLYVWGSNEHGQLGLDAPAGPIPTRMKWCTGFIFRGVAVSKCHTVAWGVNRKGPMVASVWTFGANHGQLGTQRKSSRDFTPDWQPRQAPFFNNDHVVVAASATSKVTVCLTEAHEVIVMKDFMCRILVGLPSPFPRGVHVYRSAKSERVVKVLCCESNICCMTDLGRLYLYFLSGSPLEGTISPIVWNVDRRSFRVVDFCIGKAETPRMIVLMVVGEDGMVYRSSVRLTQGNIEVTPTRVPCINQTDRIWCGPHAEHVFGAVRSRRLQQYPVHTPSDASFNVPDLDVTDRRSLSGGQTVELCFGTASSCSELQSMVRSPYLAISCLSRWQFDEDVTSRRSLRVMLPHQPKDISDHDASVILAVLVQYLQRGSMDSVEQLATVASLVELLQVAHSLLLISLVERCECAIAVRMGLADVFDIFPVALRLKAPVVIHRCAELLVSNLEDLLESKKIQMLPRAALQAATEFYRRTFRSPRTYGLTLAVPCRTAVGPRRKRVHHVQKFKAESDLQWRNSASSASSVHSHGLGDNCDIRSNSSSSIGSDLKSANLDGPKISIDLRYMDAESPDSYTMSPATVATGCDHITKGQQFERRSKGDSKTNVCGTPPNLGRNQGKTRQQVPGPSEGDLSAGSLSTTPHRKSSRVAKRLSMSAVADSKMQPDPKPRGQVPSFRKLMEADAATAMQTSRGQKATTSTNDSFTRASEGWAVPSKKSSTVSFRALLAQQEEIAAAESKERAKATAQAASKSNCWGTQRKQPVTAFESVLAHEANKSSSITIQDGPRWGAQSNAIKITPSPPHWRHAMIHGEAPQSPIVASSITSGSPRHHSGHIDRTPLTGFSPRSNTPSFMDIMNDEKLSKDITTRDRSKSMRAIQLEEQALKEFKDHYTLVYGNEEWIDIHLSSKLK